MQKELVKKYRIVVKAYNFNNHYGTHIVKLDVYPTEEDIISALIEGKKALHWGTREALIEEVYELIKIKDEKDILR
jgi:hypothetical protein